MDVIAAYVDPDKWKLHSNTAETLRRDTAAVAPVARRGLRIKSCGQAISTPLHGTRKRPLGGVGSLWLHTDVVKLSNQTLIYLVVTVDSNTDRSTCKPFLTVCIVANIYKRSIGVYGIPASNNSMRLDRL